MHFNTSIHPIIKCRAMTNIQHTGIGTSIKTDLHSIYSIRRDKLIRIVYTEISCWKAYFTSNLITANHRPIQKIIIPKTTRSHLNISLMEIVTNHGRTDMDLLIYIRARKNYLHTDFFTITAIIFKALTTIMTKAMIVTNYKRLYLVTFLQNGSHKIPGSKPGYLRSKIEHNAIIYSGFSQ